MKIGENDRLHCIRFIDDRKQNTCKFIVTFIRFRWKKDYFWGKFQMKIQLPVFGSKFFFEREV